MADKKNIVIRVNYPKAGNRMEKPLSAPELITEWHFKRIFLAVAAVVLICVVAFLAIKPASQTSRDNTPVVLSGPVKAIKVVPEPAKVAAIKEAGENVRIEKQSAIKTMLEPTTAPVSPVITEKTPVPDLENQAAIKANTTQTKAEDEIAGLKTEATEEKPALSKNKEPVKNSPSPIDDKGVSRALLTTGINNREPIDNFIAPVKIGDKQKLALYYFTELRNLKERALYHEWLRNGKVVAKRQLYIGADRWRTSSKMTFSDRNKGNWTVRLVDKTGLILNKISFAVVSDE